MAVNGQTEAKVELVPWDPTDEKQFQRMVDQRTACGWAQDEVPEWKPKALEGKKFLYWIVSWNTSAVLLILPRCS